MKLKIQLNDIRSCAAAVPSYSGTIELPPELVKLLHRCDGFENSATIHARLAALEALNETPPAPAPATAGGLTDLTEEEIRRTTGNIDYCESKGECYITTSTQFLNRAMKQARESIAAKDELANLKHTVSIICGKHMRDHIFAEAAKAGRVS